MSENIVDILTATLAVGRQDLAAAGRIFFLMRASAPIDVSFLDGVGRTIGTAQQLRAGTSIVFDDNLFRLVVTSGVAQEIQYAVAEAPVTFNEVSGHITATITGATTLTDNPVVAVNTATPELLAPADTARPLLVVRNLTTDNLYLGGPAVTAATAAYELEPGQSYELPSPQAAWYAIALADGDVAVLTGVA
jgi:hypothetical protein